MFCPRMILGYRSAPEIWAHSLVPTILWHKYGYGHEGPRSDCPLAVGRLVNDFRECEAFFGKVVVHFGLLKGLKPRNT